MVAHRTGRSGGFRVTTTHKLESDRSNFNNATHLFDCLPAFLELWVVDVQHGAVKGL
jgi:hypothetical protein